MASPDLRSSFSFGSGDTRLLVSSPEGEITASVSSHAMSLASPVWRKFISPPWRPSQIDKKKKASRSEDNEGVKLSSEPEPDEPLDFREDDAEALLLLLRIAHLDFVSVKKRLSVEELYNLAILCDKYDCVHLIKPWVDEWYRDAELLRVVGESSKRLFIAWSFGRIENFKIAASVLLMQGGTDENGQLLDLKGQAVPEVMPPGIIEEIMFRRRTAIENLLEIPRRRIKTYKDNKTTICRYNRPGCDAIIYGSLLRGLDIHDLHPDMKPEDVRLSITALAEIMSKLKMYPYYSANGGVHDDCSLSEFASATASILSNIGSPVLESHVRHMKEQSKKLLGELEP
ncbi:hypothetical protein N431DRAFT_447657 [Stipitochalara longipes BDJ]|nr:hypothetical protein N431DRAFT_447657 [Stipitochalara longipes BDJ]